MVNRTEDLIVHKATRECPMIEPHSRAICGLLRLREKIQAEADAAHRAAGGDASETVKG
jgi:hypothetical protein